MTESAQKGQKRKGDPREDVPMRQEGRLGPDEKGMIGPFKKRGGRGGKGRKKGRRSPTAGAGKALVIEMLVGDSPPNHPQGTLASGKVQPSRFGEKIQRSSLPPPEEKELTTTT